jgi:hypothetical protein
MVTNNKVSKRLKLQLNWSFRLLLFIGLFVLSFVFFRYVFDSELGFSIFMSFTFAAFDALFLFAGVDGLFVKNRYKDLVHQSSVYLNIHTFFYCPGRLVIFEDKLIFITHKINFKPHKIEIDFHQISSVEKSKSILSKRNLTIHLENEKPLNFYWVENVERCVELLTTEKVKP